MGSSYGLTIPGNDASLFNHPATIFSPTITSRPDRFILFKPVTRFSITSLKLKAVLGETVVTDSSFYGRLGIPESGTLLEIKQAYKQLARKYHPDVSPPDRIEEYTQRFIQVQEAYETLSDPRRRAIYDRDLARGINLAFSARKKGYQNGEDLEVRSEWKNQWESQLSELKRRSMEKDSEENMSWAARMRRQRERSSKEV